MKTTPIKKLTSSIAYIFQYVQADKAIQVRLGSVENSAMAALENTLSPESDNRRGNCPYSYF